MMRKIFEVFADYHQVLLKASPHLPAPEEITQDDCYRRILAAPGVVTLMPERNMHVIVSVETCVTAPRDSLDDYDHVAEASIDLAEGRVVVDDLHGILCEEIEVAPGSYRVRFAGSGFSTLSEDKLDGEDRYEVTLWQAPYSPVAVLKQHGWT